MAELDDTRTLAHLEQAYSREAQAHVRYHFAARLADAAARPDIARVLRAAADEERGHALGFLDLLVENGASNPQIVGQTLADNLEASIDAELHEFTTLYTRYAEIAAEEGFPEIARWFLALAEAGQTHARWLQQCLDGLERSP